MVAGEVEDEAVDEEEEEEKPLHGMAGVDDNLGRQG